MKRKADGRLKNMVKMNRNGIPMKCTTLSGLVCFVCLFFTFLQCLFIFTCQSSRTSPAINEQMTFQSNNVLHITHYADQYTVDRKAREIYISIKYVHIMEKKTVCAFGNSVYPQRRKRRENRNDWLGTPTFHLNDTFVSS